MLKQENYWALQSIPISISLLFFQKESTAHMKKNCPTQSRVEKQLKTQNFGKQ